MARLTTQEISLQKRELVKRKRDLTKGKLIVFAALAVALLVVAVFGQWMTPCDPYSQNLSQSLAAPSAEHWLGCDNMDEICSLV